MADISYEENNTMYEVTLPVLACHLNFGNHLGYDSLLSIMQDARMHWLKSNNMSELSIFESIGYQVVSVAVEYKTEAHYSDSLKIQIYISDVTKKTCVFNYRVINESSIKVVAIAKTKHIFYDNKIKKIANIPENFIATINL